MQSLSQEEINTRYADEKTLLMIAASRGYNELVKYLLKNGAEHTLIDINGKTAWHHAQKNSCLLTVHLLERYAHAFTQELLLRNKFSNKLSKADQLPSLPPDLSKLIALYTLGYQL